MVRKSSVTDANAEYVQRLRGPENATNEQIQTALHQLFNQGPQGKSVKFREYQGPQGHTFLSKTSPQGTCCALCPGVVDWHNCGTALDALRV